MFWSYLEWKYGNNALSYNERKKLWSNLKLFIPEILDLWKVSGINDVFDYLSLWNKIVFEEIEKWKLVSKTWLNKYLIFEFEGIKYAIFDNHNVALYFLWKNYLDTNKTLDLIHIDQHSDMRKPDYIPDNITNIRKLIEYTFKWTNVWNYLVPAKKLWFVGEIYQVRTEFRALQLNENFVKWKIINIDLDFWAKEMWTTKESLKKIKNLLKYSRMVLIATSPFFIDQEESLKILEEFLKLES